MTKVTEPLSFAVPPNRQLINESKVSKKQRRRTQSSSGTGVESRKKTVDMTALIIHVTTTL
eukprot:scaffold32130_cov47-Attheya_sp.AAC.4